VWASIALLIITIAAGFGIFYATQSFTSQAKGGLGKTFMVFAQQISAAIHDALLHALFALVVITPVLCVAIPLYALKDRDVEVLAAGALIGLVLMFGMWITGMWADMVNAFANWPGGRG